MLSADRELYWTNRLSKICIYCSQDLHEYVITNPSYSLYRYQACGHTFCENCSSSARLKLQNCGKCGVAKIANLTISRADLQEDSNEYHKEVLEAVKNEAGAEKTKLEQKISALEEELETAKKAKESDEAAVVCCMDCGYDVVFEKSRICVTRGIEHGILTKEVMDDENEDIKIVSFDKAEVSLLCGSCVLDGKHVNHQTVNYFNLKMKQMSLTQKDELCGRLEAAFDKDWDTVCQKMKESHLPIVELLEKCVEQSSNQDNWSKFKRMQTNLNSIVQRVVDQKTSMVGNIHKYTCEMKGLLAEAQNILNDALPKIEKTEEAEEEQAVLTEETQSSGEKPS